MLQLVLTFNVTGAELVTEGGHCPNKTETKQDKTNQNKTKQNKTKQEQNTPKQSKGSYMTK